VSGKGPAPLADVQAWMLAALLRPEGVDREALDRHLVAGPRLDAAMRLSVYQRSYVSRLVQCLSEQFPALCHALGEALFADFARAYLRDEPSESHTLYDLGRRFPGWLEASRPDRDRPAGEREDWIDFMVDLARYERELFRLFDAPVSPGASLVRGHRAARLRDLHLPRQRAPPPFPRGARAERRRRRGARRGGRSREPPPARGRGVLGERGPPRVDRGRVLRGPRVDARGG
jgi:hypothetical protein